VNIDLLGPDVWDNEIAFSLGFEHSQSFHRLFKSKTNQSPLEFRERFNWKILQWLMVLRWIIPTTKNLYTKTNER